MSAQSYALNELNKETTIGGLGEESDRQILQIDLADFDNRKAEIAEALWEASTTVGFFQLVNHGIPQAQIDEAFELEEKFFALSAEEKSAFPAASRHQCRLGIQGAGTPLHRYGGPEGKLPDHAAAHERPVAE